MSETESVTDYSSDDDDTTVVSSDDDDDDVEESEDDVTSPRDVRYQEPTDEELKQYLSKRSPKEIYKALLKEGSGKKHRKSKHHSRSRSRSPDKRRKRSKKDKSGLDEPKSKKSRKSKNNDSSVTPPPPPSRMTKAELQIELKKCREKIAKFTKKLEKSVNPKKDKKLVVKDSKEVEEEEEEEPKPLGNDIQGREIQGEPISPVYIK